MSRDLTFWQWLIIITFLLAISGLVISISLLLLQSQNFINVVLEQVQQIEGGVKQTSPESYTESSKTPTRTPFQPLFVWTRTLTPTVTLTPSPTPTVTLTPTQTNTPEPTFTPIPTDTPLPIPTAAPEEAYISGFVGNSQFYNLDCEARSAVDLAAFFGISINEQKFLDQIPKSTDPDSGFVGNYTGAKGQIPPASYGVHAGPVATLLQQYCLRAFEVHGSSWETVKNEILTGRPVMVWVVNNTLPGQGIQYKAPNGHITTVAHFEHTVIVVGFNPRYVTIVDGSETYIRTVQQFLNSWSVLGYMAIMVQP